MSFPVIFNLWGFSLHSHTLFECLGYFLGFQTYLLMRRNHPAQSVPTHQMVWVLVGAIFGAWFGSKLLAIAEQTGFDLSRIDLATLWAGKTIVGGLLGGWVGVEIAKFALRIPYRTGDLLVIPLAIGMAVGRVGCFLAGLADNTHGNPTSLPIGLDFGDGIPRHPTQLYDIALLGLLSGVVWFSRIGNASPGDKFRFFLSGYLAYRFMVEFIKPSPKEYLGLSAIQWACLVGCLICVIQLIVRHRQKRQSGGPPVAISIASPASSSQSA